MTEWSFEDICELLDQARDCGITSFQITGGEPMAHRRFLDILREIYKRDMDVFAINTNGWYLTQEVLDEMKAISCAPTMKISFDGIGFHDWIRQREGAQKSAFSSMELCVENGLDYEVKGDRSFTAEREKDAPAPSPSPVKPTPTRGDGCLTLIDALGRCGRPRRHLTSSSIG